LLHGEFFADLVCESGRACCEIFSFLDRGKATTVNFAAVTTGAQLSWFLGLIGLFGPLTLAKADTRAAAVLVDEFDAPSRKSIPDCLDCSTRYLASFLFKIHDGR